MGHHFAPSSWFIPSSQRRKPATPPWTPAPSAASKIPSRSARLWGSAGHPASEHRRGPRTSPSSPLRSSGSARARETWAWKVERFRNGTREPIETLDSLDTRKNCSFQKIQPKNLSPSHLSVENLHPTGAVRQRASVAGGPAGSLPLLADRVGTSAPPPPGVELLQCRSSAAAVESPGIRHSKSPRRGDFPWENYEKCGDF
jgi:hypothetical protein